MLTSKITERSQTTVPAGVRAALGLRPGERLGYIIQGDEVKLVNASAVAEVDDPVLERFLGMLTASIEKAEHVAPFPHSLLERARAITEGIEIDHDSPIDGVTAL
ncbi:MAG TPA: type II toxin-antitoxin system PrlF family antitoxin [Longimicrobiales bacterium]|nr:type II toxin-antitoxin system PrlF family antitoxin [Longimicrobiales bacterium]